MAGIEPMAIDGGAELRREIDGPDQKKKPLKRKRVEASLYVPSTEEKQSKIKELRSEIDSLVKFCRDLGLENRGAFLEYVEKFGNSSNCVIACLMEESELPLTKLVDEVFERVKGVIGNGESVSKSGVKSSVLMIGQRLCYGVSGTEADVLEDESECALWCWETRDLKLMPQVLRGSLKVRRTCRKKIHERISAVLAMINALENSVDHRESLKEIRKASKKLCKILNEADIRLLMESMSQKNGPGMAEKDSKKEEKLLVKQMEKNKREMDKERKKMDRELQKEKLQSEKELKRLQDEAEKEQRRKEKEEHEMQKQLKRQQEEAEKDQRHKEKEEAELKKQLALQKQASLMERFLKKKKTNTTSENDSSMNKVITSDTVERKSESFAQAMDSILVTDVGHDSESIWRSHINSWNRIGRSIRTNRKIHWGIRQKPKTELVKELKLTTNKETSSDEDIIVEKLEDGWVDSSIDGKLNEIDMERPICDDQMRIRSKQLLQFDKSHRPAFYGVWPRRSKVVGARHPFAKDPEIDYEVDSDEEWEEEEPGESLSDCDKEDEDECIAGLKGDDEDESEDGFFVPDGYLSENEGVEVDEMECDELANDVKDVLDSENQIQTEEFCTLLKQQKYLNNLTEHALKKNQPLIILNLMHEKSSLSAEEELTGTKKLEQMCLQALNIRPLPDFPNIEISIDNDVTNEDLEASPSKPSTTPLATAPAVSDSYLPQIISIIHSCPHGIGKIVKSLHNKFPALPKSQLRNKVREISEFSDNRWQVKKEILCKFGISISPELFAETNCGKAKSIASFFSKRCLPPSGKTMSLTETSPQPSKKIATIIHPHLESPCEQ